MLLLVRAESTTNKLKHRSAMNVRRRQKCRAKLYVGTLKIYPTLLVRLFLIYLVKTDAISSA